MIGHPLILAKQKERGARAALAPLPLLIPRADTLLQETQDLLRVGLDTTEAEARWWCAYHAVLMSLEEIKAGLAVWGADHVLPRRDRRGNPIYE